MNYDDIQGIDPAVFSVIGDLVGVALAGNLPFNVQNSIGNWLCLLGQTIVTFNAQQQTYVQGPGECFNPKDYNRDNPNCQSGSGSGSGSGNTCNCQDEINELKDSICVLIDEVNRLKKEVNKLKEEK